MQRLNRLYLFMAAVACIAIISSCDKTKAYKVLESEPQVHFNNTMNTASKYLPYYITNSATSTFTLKVGTTDVSDEDRTVSWQVASPSGAVAGTHYSMVTTGNTVTIPAGQTTADIVVHGIFAPYAAGTRKDTLVFTLQQPSTVHLASFGDTVKLVLQRYCDVLLPSLSGNYNNTLEYDAVPGPPTWGPYTTTISNVVSTGATSAQANVDNVYDYGGTVVIKFDWADPANFKVSIAEQYTGVNVTSGGTPYQLWLRTSGAGLNTFSSCDNNITLTIDALAKNITTGALVGTFSVNYRIVLNR